tara:strand:+ start:2146 stop:2334 length:189 start_codon:yes stop_codon:yes gene_type:complete
MATTRKGINKKLNFGKEYPDKTAKQIIDSGDYKYIEFLFDNNICIFSVETYKYIENYKLKNK